MCNIVSVFLSPTDFGNLRFCDQEGAIKFPLCYISWIHTEDHSPVLQIAKISGNLVIPGTCALFLTPYLMSISSVYFIKRKSFSIKIILIVEI